MMAQNLFSIKTTNSQPTITDKTNALVKEEEKNNFPLPVWKQLHALLSFFLYAVSSNRWLYPNQINSTTTTTKQREQKEGERTDWAKKKKPKNSSRHRKQDLNFPLQSII